MDVALELGGRLTTRDGRRAQHNSFAMAARDGCVTWPWAAAAAPWPLFPVADLPKPEMK